MILKRVRYQNFRNIASADISFSPGINLFCGDNAQGKTNALEGIYLFAQGRSHRTAKEKDYITYEQDFAKVILDYENKQRENQLELRYLRSGRKFCRKNQRATFQRILVVIFRNITRKSIFRLTCQQIMRSDLNSAKPLIPWIVYHIFPALPNISRIVVFFTQQRQ